MNFLRNEEIRSQYDAVVICLPFEQNGKFTTTVNEIAGNIEGTGKKYSVTTTFLNINSVNKCVTRLRAFLETKCLFKNQFKQFVVKEELLTKILQLVDDSNEMIQNEVTALLDSYTENRNKNEKQEYEDLLKRKISNPDSVLNKIMSAYPSRNEIMAAKIGVNFDYYENSSKNSLEAATIKMIDEQKAENVVTNYYKSVIRALIPVYEKLGKILTQIQENGEILTKTQGSMKKSVNALLDDNEIIKSPFIKKVYNIAKNNSFFDRVDLIESLLINIYKEAKSVELEDVLPKLDIMDSDTLDMLAETVVDLEALA